MLICCFPEAVCLLAQSLGVEGCKKQGLRGGRVFNVLVCKILSLIQMYCPYIALKDKNAYSFLSCGSHMGKLMKRKMVSGVLN